MRNKGKEGLIFSSIEVSINEEERKSFVDQYKRELFKNKSNEESIWLIIMTNFDSYIHT